MKQLRMSSSNNPTSERIEEVESDPFSVALTIALTALGRRSLSKSELSKHLSKRGASDEIRDSVLLRVEEMGYINDLDFARAFSDRTRRVKKSSKRVISQGLREKGIDQETIDWVIEDIPESSDLELAQEFARKKWRPRAGEEIETTKRRVAGALMRRGFPSQMINEVIRELAKQ